MYKLEMNYYLCILSYLTIIIIYNINGYFNPMIKMLEKAIDERFMTEACLKLFNLCNTSEEVFYAVENYTPNMYDKYEF